MIGFFETYGSLIVSMFLGAMLGLSLYLPLMAGQLSLASPGFFALGGYIAAILSTQVFTNFEALPILYLLIEMLVAAVVCGLLGILVGIPALRLRGIYLAIATIAFVEILRILALNLEITGGAVGIFAIPQPFPSHLGYLSLVIPMVILSGAFVYRLEKIRVGRALIAIREDELAADAMGINTTYYKVLAFTLGAILAGMVGVINAHFLNTWNARQGTFDASIIYLTFVLIGGSRTYLGPILGGMVFTVLPEVLRGLGDTAGLPPWLGGFLKDGRLIIFGVMIVLSSIFFPRGLVTPEFSKGLEQNVRSLLKKRKPKS